MICSAHTFHNCHTHRCKPSQTRRVRQERRDIARLVDEYKHDTYPSDRVLNLAQLRSAADILAFANPGRYPGRDLADITEEVIPPAGVQVTASEQAPAAPAADNPTQREEESCTTAREIVPPVVTELVAEAAAPEQAQAAPTTDDPTRSERAKRPHREQSPEHILQAPKRTRRQ